MFRYNVNFSILLQYQYGAGGKTGLAEQIKTSRRDKYFVQPAALFSLFQGRSQSFGFTLKRLISLGAAFSLRGSSPLRPAVPQDLTQAITVKYPPLFIFALLSRTTNSGSVALFTPRRVFW